LFHAADCIRDATVTGVQTCALPISHSIGVPVATHEIYPAAFVGVDNTEHTAATSRRGYSPKMATLSRAYEDVVQLFGKSQRILRSEERRGGKGSGSGGWAGRGGEKG